MSHNERFPLGSVRGPRHPSGAGKPVFSDTGWGTREPGQHIFGDYLGFPDPTLWYVSFDDFIKFNASDWSITTVEAGSGAAQEDLVGLFGGAIRLLNDDADNDSDHVAEGGFGSHVFAASRVSLFSCKFSVSDAVQTDIEAGLVNGAFDPFSGVFFRKDDGDQQLDLVVKVGGAVVFQATNIFTIPSGLNNFIDVQYVYDGEDTLIYGVNGKMLGSLKVDNSLVTGEALKVGFGVRNGEAASKSMQVDYFLAAHRRG